LRINAEPKAAGVKWMANRGIRLQNYALQHSMGLSLVTSYRSVFEHLKNSTSLMQANSLFVLKSALCRIHGI